ncbi:hypothetical protein FSS13T_17440 [Flavobacterium saliperosum S13]|uniref:Por secretion system C-terminal sorting domain-containing protein n=2 Tax=Flavobacterium saliperosum TaxID=329186 RepID=A0A1G4VJ30_9FLAO|nr:DUF4832 domain-containing protein [Flavobacterium saliperosum]ESU25508.1 hypothetical protein FSS13T_17440 [Flavobacterium saliperosum S13]SCX07540.1 Por secretion system C-terminal sorting domain-containing protein [Flavobacterium saliperosum]
MKKSILTLVLLFSIIGFAQTNTNVTYTASSENFSNPERGLYHHTETHSTGYSSLSQSTLTNYRNNEKITLILRVFYLENFRSSAISQDYLNKMQADFNAIRNAGIKCIVRFAYSDTDVAGQRDASKTQILAHIEQLRPLLQNNVDVIAVMQAGFIGSWGEWYYTDYFGMSPSSTDYANRKAVVDGILSALPASRMVQIRTPKLKQATYSTTSALTQSQAYNGSALSRLAHHNDCFLSSSTDFGTYTNTSTEYPYLEQETKFLAMGGETCAVNEPRSGCLTAVQEMKKFHWSYLNVDYNAAVISGFSSNGCLNDIKNQLGYRFEMVNGSFPQSANIGGSMAVNLKIRNTGYATPYNQRTAYIVFKNTVTNDVYTKALASDPRLWTSQAETTIAENITLPSNITQGSYRLYLVIPDAASGLSARPEYSIRMANANTWDATTGYNNLNAVINVGSQSNLGTSDNTLVNALIYPVPANNEIFVEMENLDQYAILIYNSLGQKVSVKSQLSANKMTIDTESLSDGVYYIKFTKDQINDTRRLVVKH